MEEGRRRHLCHCAKNTPPLTCICKADQREMLGCLSASYLRLEPGKSCCSQSRFQWSELLSAAAGHQRPRMFSFPKHLTRHRWAQCHFFCGLQRLLLRLSFLLSSTHHLLFSLTLFNVRVTPCLILFAMSGTTWATWAFAAEGKASQPRRRRWGRFALIMLTNSRDAVE